MCKKITSHLQLPIEIQPYISKSSDVLFNKLLSEKTIKGITVTSSGFYGPQGRSLRLGLRISEMNQKLSSFQFDGHKISNFEMESSALFALGKELGHNCAAICLGVANRPKNEFTKGFETEMKNLIQYVIDRI